MKLDFVICEYLLRETKWNTLKKGEKPRQQMIQPSCTRYFSEKKNQEIKKKEVFSWAEKNLNKLRVLSWGWKNYALKKESVSQTKNLIIPLNSRKYTQYYFFVKGWRSILSGWPKRQF